MTFLAENLRPDRALLLISDKRENRVLCLPIRRLARGQVRITCLMFVSYRTKELDLDRDQIFGDHS